MFGSSVRMANIEVKLDEETTRLGPRTVLSRGPFPTPRGADPSSCYRQPEEKKCYLLFPLEEIGDVSVGFHENNADIQTESPVWLTASRDKFNPAIINYGSK